MTDQFMPAVYSLIEAVHDGKIAEGEAEYHHDTDELEMSVAITVRREVRHLYPMKEHPSDG